MNCYLKAIVLLGKDNSRRIVPLQPGVNIITGDSKTGKSALVEIIDYCLCSSHCSVPKGIITEYTSIYCILIHIDKAAYCVARRSAAENGHMYFLKMDDTFAGSDIIAENLQGGTDSAIDYLVTVGFRASAANPTYGASATVMPSSINLPIILYMGIAA